MSLVLHFKHVCLVLNADDSPSKAKVQHVDMPLSNAEKTDNKNKDGELTDPTQGKRKNGFLQGFFLTFTTA